MIHISLPVLLPALATGIVGLVAGYLLGRARGKRTRDHENARVAP